jgi:hypothetical protein
MNEGELYPWRDNHATTFASSSDISGALYKGTKAGHDRDVLSVFFSSRTYELF